MKHVQVRIIGNDLPPRHAANNTIRQVSHQLEYDIQHPDLQIVWLFNRIVNRDVQAEVQKRIASRGQCSLDIPFIREEYFELSTAMERAHYLTNINSARNDAIRVGFELYGADYVLPTDGGCMFLRDGFEAFNATCQVNLDDPVFMIPMWRVQNYKDTFAGVPMLAEEWIIDSELSPNVAYAVFSRSEPQLAFHSSFKPRKVFNPDILYGNCDKVDLLQRLGIPGVWDNFEVSTENAMPDFSSEPYYGKVKGAGYICRLPTGNPEADASSKVRSVARHEGLMELVRKVDAQCS